MKALHVVGGWVLLAACLHVRAQGDWPESFYHGEGSYRFGMRFEHRRTLSGDYDSFNVGTFIWEERWGTFSAGMTLGGGDVELTRGSFADSQTGNPYELEMGVFARCYFAPQNVPLRPYVAAGVDIINITWSYRTPVLSGSDIIRSDHVQGIGGSVAFGLSIEATKKIHLFGEAGVGAMGMFCNTSEGLHNDLFDSFTYASVKVGVTFSF